MLFTRFALWIRLLFPLFARVKVDRRWVDAVNEQASEGTVIYVVEMESVLDYSLLHYLLRRNGLPVPEVSNSRVHWLARPLWYLLLGPFIWLFQKLFRRQSLDQRFYQGIKEGKTALLFLKRAQFVSLPRGNIGVSYLKELISMQGEIEKPLILVPQLLFWSPAPDRYRKGIMHLILGDPNVPGFRRLLSFLSGPVRAYVTSGPALNLKANLEEADQGFEGEATDGDTTARRVQWLLHRAIDMEEKTVRGPMLKTARQVREEMLLDPNFSARIEAIGKEQGLTSKQSKKRVAEYIHEIAADFRIGYIEFLTLVLTPIFKRVFSSFVVDREAIETIREASRDSAVVLVPSHRSHIDYLVISYLLYLKGVIPPHIAAGSNLSFFPMGHIFRHCGAFFIRRKTGDDGLYSISLSQYIRKLLKDGHSFEFFIEGGRSRTGKTLQPKFGLLSYVVEAVTSQAVKDVTVIPIALSYERIMEMEGYTRELAGGEKRAEDLGGLVRSAEVLDTTNGRLYITAGRPLKIGRFVKNSFDKPIEEITTDERRYLIKRLGYLILDRINRATVVNPSGLVATVLLSHHRRGISRERFLEVAGHLLHFARQRGYMLSITLERALKAAAQELLKARERTAGEPNDPSLDRARGEAVASILDEALELFRNQGYIHVEEFDGSEVISVLPSSRLFLNYYRNNLLHVFQREGLVASAILTRQHQHLIRVSEVQEDVRFLSKLLKQEFIFRVGDFERGVLAGLASLSENGIVGVRNEVIEVIPEQMERLHLFRNIILPIVESYLVAARYASAVRFKGAMKSRDLARAILKKASKDYQEGAITCNEALSTANITNALAHFEAIGVLKKVESGIDAGKLRLARGSAWEDLKVWEERIARFVEIP